METYCFLKYYSFSSGATIYCDWYHMPQANNFRGGSYSGGESHRTQNYRETYEFMYFPVRSEMIRAHYFFYNIFFPHKMEPWVLTLFGTLLTIFLIIAFICVIIFKAKFITYRFKAAKKIAQN